MSVTDAVRHGSRDVIFESYPGGRLQLPDDGHAGGGLGREQLMRLGGIVEARRRLAAALQRDRLGRIPA